jgi:hypothetical protein
MPIVLFLIVLLTAFVVGLLGSTRRIGFLLPFFASFLITPLGAAVLVVISGRKVRRSKKKIPRRD